MEEKYGEDMIAEICDKLEGEIYNKNEEWKNILRDISIAQVKADYLCTSIYDIKSLLRGIQEQMDKISKQ